MKILKNSRSVLIFLIIIHVGFFVSKIFIGNYFLQDSYDYCYLAENIKNHFAFYCANLNEPIVFENFTKRPPVYGLFVLVFSFFTQSKVLVLLAQNILSIISILLTIRIFNKHFNNTTKNKIFLILIAVSISQFIYANYLMSEILLQFLVIVLCYSFQNTLAKKSLWWLFGFQLIIILLFLTKPVFYLFVIPNVFICLWLSKHISKASFFSLVPIIALVMYMSWNKERTGHFEFSSIQNLALKNYNLLYFQTNKYNEDYALKINEKINKEIAQLDSYKEKQQAIKLLSTQYIKKDLFSYAWFHLKGSLRMFIDPGRFDLYNFFNFSNKNEVGFLAHINSNGVTGAFNYFKKQPFIIILLLPIILIFNLLKLYGFCRFWITNYKIAPPVLWFAFFIIIYITFLTGPLAASRFLVPLLPLYCMFASLGLLIHFKSFKNHNKSNLTI
ncbi:glycosyltransferase family protein [Mariniflexile fucanivorans]|nr:glycosyltransferase family 39 protein [Mariniflexile fucanivorans]